MAKIKDKVKEWREYILLFLAVLQVAGIAAAAYVSARMSPLQQDIALIKQEVSANSELDRKEHASFVTSETFKAVIERINHISSRVDQIYTLIR